MAFLEFKNIRIAGIAAGVPKNVFSNYTLKQGEDISSDYTPEAFVETTGVKERRCSDALCTSDLCYAAAERLIAELKWDKSEIEALVFVSQTADYFLPATACILQDRLGIPTSAGAFDYNLGCSGCIYGMAVAKGLIAAGIAKNILLLTAETYNKYLHPEDKSNRSIFGDGAAACLISTEGFAEIQDFVLGTDGKGADNLIVKTGAARHLLPTGKSQEDDEGHIWYDDYLYMNGGAIFNFTLDAVPAMIQQLLEKHHLSQDDINYYVFHQANKFMLSTIRKFCVLPKDKFYINMEEVGNTVSSTVLIGLKDCIERQVIKPHDTVMIAGFGVGLSWGGTILKFQ